MRIRDKHFLLAEVGMTSACVLTAALAGFCVLRETRRLRARVDDVEARMASAERTCADAVGAALALADAAGQAHGDTDTDTIDAAPALLGYGQTRSRAALYVYADFRYADGHVERRYVQRIPISAGPSSGGLGDNRPPDEAVSPPGSEATK